MKFAQLGDCHLGGWRQPELQLLNFQSFQYAISKCIKEAVDFVLGEFNSKEKKVQNSFDLKPNQNFYVVIRKRVKDQDVVIYR